MGLLPLPSWHSAGQLTASHADETPELLQAKWARASESQAPHKVKQGRTIGEDKSRLATEELLLGRSIAEQNRNATAVVGALHVGPGVADEPNSLTGLDAARRESERDRGGGRRVLRPVPPPDDAAEQLRPADPLGLAPQQSAGLVAHHPEENTVGAERAEQFTAARQRTQPVEMDRANDIEIDSPRLLPPLAEMKRKAFAQTEPDAFFGLPRRPQRLLHRRHDGVQRFVDRRPAVDQGVVPVEQDRPGPAETWRRCRRDIAGPHAATAPRAREYSRNLR